MTRSSRRAEEMMTRRGCEKTGSNFFMYLFPVVNTYPRRATPSRINYNLHDYFGIVRGEKDHSYLR